MRLGKSGAEDEDLQQGRRAVLYSDGKCSTRQLGNTVGHSKIQLKTVIEANVVYGYPIYILEIKRVRSLAPLSRIFKSSETDRF